MAKAAILDVLESTIGRYVQNLDAQSLNVAVWSGKIELNSLRLDVHDINCELKRRALEEPKLALPFRILKGSVESVCVDVPWSRITSHPVVLRAKGLNCVIEPYNHLAGDERSEDNIGTTSSDVKEQRRKLKRDERVQSLRHAEEVRQRRIAMRKLTDFKGNSDDDDDKENVDGHESMTPVGFQARLVRRIVENLQLEIDGVHFEIHGQGCDAGVVLEHFSIITTDKDGNKTFVDRASNSNNAQKSFLYKALQLKGLGIYCDPTHATVQEDEEGYSLQTSTNGTNHNKQHNRSFILDPLSFEAKMRLSDNRQCIDFPKYLLTSHLKAVSIVLTRTQLELIHDILEALTPDKNMFNPLFPEYRPTDPISKGTAKLWWNYAVRSVGRINRRRSWAEFFIAFKKRKEYLSLYKRMMYHSSCNWLSPLTENEKVKIDRLEFDRTISPKAVMGWRNLADAQIQLERKKYEVSRRASMERANISPGEYAFSFFFGTKSDALEQPLLDEQQRHENGDESLLTLTTEEMKELQLVVFDDSVVKEKISNDSKICDVEFKLGSFKVDIISFTSQPIASLYMGAVSTALKANADGSFLFNFKLSSLNVHDQITPNSLFPIVVQSLESTPESKSKFANAFEFKLMKDGNGDHELITKIVSFQIVASSILLKEMKEFAQFQSSTEVETTRFTIEQISNSILYFYDVNDLGEVSDKVASCFADAWDSKVEKENLWKVHIEVYAPILVLPKSCMDRMAPMLVIDLGNFCFTSGTSDPSSEVQSWFNSQPMNRAGFNSSTLQMENLSFFAAKAGDKDFWVTYKFTGDSIISSKAIIQPVTLLLNIGIEKNTNKDIPPRKCMFGVIPSINMDISSSDVDRMMSVLTTWGTFMNSMSSDPELIQESDKSEENADDRGPFVTLNSKGKRQSVPDTKPHERVMAKTHLSLAFTKLSLKITDDEGDSIEAHLVSAVTSHTQNNDGSSSARVRMGYFWILDRLKPEIDGTRYPREQRLIVHSCLPASATFFAQNHKYDIMGELERQGLLDNINRKSALADIKVTKFVSFVPSPIDQSIVTSQSQFNSVTKIDAKFSTLFINWNPYAIRHLFDFKDNLVSFRERVVPLHISTKSMQLYGGLDHQPSASKISIGQTMLILNVQMEALDLCLNSAKDDLPLFQVTMVDAKIKLHSSNDNGYYSQLAFVDVGDFRLEVPSNEIILSKYCTVLGLSPHHSSSLLSIEYGTGSIVVDNCPEMKFENEKAGSFMKIALSPMRMVHVQAQVYTLTEYISTGILGTFAGKVASSAAWAAKEIAEAETGGTNVFFVSAEGFDFVLPQAIDTYDNICLKCGHLSITYRSIIKPSGYSEAKLRVDDVAITRNNKENIVETPIRMDIYVKYAPLDAKSEEERATKVVASMSSVTFLLTKDQFFQVQRTLTYNIGELNSYLRGEEELSPLNPDNSCIESKGGIPALTHGGAEEIIIEIRTRIKMVFESISLELCGKNAADPIISIAAVKTSITLDLQPDTQTTNAVATMHDLVCYDKRLIARNRHFRQIISQVGSKHLPKDPDVFNLSYFTSYKDNSMNVDLGIGSPQVLLVGDLILDLLAFFADNEQMPQKIPSISKDVSIEMEEDTEAVEIAISKVTKISSRISVKTDDCRLVLIDVGSAQKDDCSSREDRSSTEVMETVVIKGQSEVSIAFVSDAVTGSLIESDVHIDTETLEVYTAEGRESNCPVQILEPLKCSMFLSTHVKENTQFVEIKFVPLTNVDLIISFQNLALLQSTISSMKETFYVEEDSSKGIQILSEKETAAIKNLALELGEGNTNGSISEVIAAESRSQHVYCTQSTEESQTNAPNGNNRVISCKMTLPFASVTVINDLQGLDEALFKLMAESCVFGAEVKSEHANAYDMTFHMYMNTRLQAEYFDSKSKLWEQLLLDVWGLNLEANREQDSHLKSTRMSTTMKIESQPCKVSFSEQFLVSLGTANSMLSAFSVTTVKANNYIDRLSKEVDKLSKEATKGPISVKSKRDLFLMKSRASCTARSFIVTMPYGIQNHCGLAVDFVVGEKRKTVDTGCTKYFRFDLPRRNGIGGVRSYGQYSINKKNIKIHVGDHQICFDNLDEMLNHPRLAHKVGSAQYIFSDVRKTGGATIVHLGSFIEVCNETSIDLDLSINIHNEIKYIGRCRGGQGHQNGKQMKRFGIPAPLLEKAYYENKKEGFDFERKVSLVVSADMDRNNKVLTGDIHLPSLKKFCKMAEENDGVKVFHLFCSTAFIPGQNASNDLDKMVLQVSCKTRLIADEHPFVEIFLQPRTVLQNNMPICLLVRTPTPHTWSETVTQDDDQPLESIHRINPFDVIEVYTPGLSIAISVKCADNPTSGTATDWNVDDWIDIPLERGKRLQQHIRSYFPFVKRSGQHLGGGGNAFFIAEASDFWGETDREGEGKEKSDVTSSSLSDVRRVVFAVDNVGVDRTGNKDILFQTCYGFSGNFSSSQLQTDRYPLSAFSSADYKRRITLLPKSDVPMRLLRPTKEGSSDTSPSFPFYIDDISLCEGGIDSTLIQWKKSNCSQYYAYRTLSSLNQAEVHIIPEFVVFNGGKHSVRMIQSRKDNGILIEAGKMEPIRRLDKQMTGLMVVLEFLDIGECTTLVQVDRLGMKMCIVKEKSSGSPVGSIAIQTVIGSRDSRFVIKLGQIKRGGAIDTKIDQVSLENVFANDILRFKVRWAQFEVAFHDTKKYLIRKRRESLGKLKPGNGVLSSEKVAQIVLEMVTVDFQRIFKDAGKSVNTARSQFTILVKNIRILDFTSNKEEEIVLESSAIKSNFLEFCARTRGSINSGLICVDNLDFKLAHGKKAEQVVVQTNENFLWNILDVAARTQQATEELSGVDFEISWDDNINDFSIKIIEAPENNREDVHLDGTYCPPKSDYLYDIRKASVSPMILVLSFKREPQSARYKTVRKVSGAKLVNYFTKKLKFTVDGARLKLPGYTVKDMRGPSDRIVETFTAFYSSQLKKRLLTLLSATHLDDWKSLAGRKFGRDEHVEGDILRVTGNLVGKSAGFIFKKAGKGIGKGLSNGTSAIGDGIQSASKTLGVGAVGTGINDLVSGIGGCVGDTIQGVGVGGNKIVKGAGKGVGQIAGGVGGGIILVGKGIGKGVKDGDGSAVANGIGDGVVSIGDGLIGGTETVVTGAVGGVYSVGKGLFSGVKKMGKGVGLVVCKKRKKMEKKAFWINRNLNQWNVLANQ